MVDPIVVGLEPTIMIIIFLQDTPQSKVICLELRVFETSATHILGAGPLGIGIMNRSAQSSGFAGLSVHHFSLLGRDLRPQFRRIFECVDR